MIKLLLYMKAFLKECILGPLFKLIEASFELMIPLVVARIVDVGIANEDTTYIFQMCLIMVVLGLVGLICAVTAQYFAAKAAVGFAALLRETLMNKLTKLSSNQIDSLGTSTMVTRLTSDTNQVQNGVNLTLRLLLRSPFVVFGAMIMAFTIDAGSALIFLAAIILLCIIVFGIMLITMPLHKKVQEHLDGVTLAVRENLSGVRVLRAFCKEKDEITNFSHKTVALEKMQIVVGKISALMNPVTMVVINLAVIVLLQSGAVKVSNGLLTQGMVVALYNYMSQILVELIKMANLIISITKAVACGNRIGDILEMEETPDVVENVHSKLSGEVEFQDVSLRYAQGGDVSLSHISFRIQAGQTIGIIGGTGAGKTSLVNLITGLYEPTEGKVLLDGMDLTKWNKRNLRKQIGYVPQKAVLFRGTIRENLSWGKENATDDELWEALEIAQAKEIVENKPKELECLVEQGGRNFSGGQRQRLTIARALVRKPGILIMDDSASALDYATDAALRQAIRDQSGKMTTFIVSQRAASVRYADFILVLDNGEMVGKGSHDELMSNCEIYREIYYSQFQREESIDV